MKTLSIVFILLSGLFQNVNAHSPVYDDAQQKEIEREIRKLTLLQQEIEQTVEKNRVLLASIHEARNNLSLEKSDFEANVATEKGHRYHALAKIFEKMDPERAGEKITMIRNPRDAAFIIYYMKSRYAGAVMNFVDPQRASSIVDILTDIKQSARP